MTLMLLACITLNLFSALRGCEITPDIQTARLQKAESCQSPLLSPRVMTENSNVNVNDAEHEGNGLGFVATKAFENRFCRQEQGSVSEPDNCSGSRPGTCSESGTTSATSETEGPGPGPRSSQSDVSNGEANDEVTVRKRTRATQALAMVPYDPSSLPVFHREGRDFTFGSHSIHIKQDWQNMGVSAVVWEAAVVLGEYLYQNKGLLQDQRVIALGAGTGLTGILAAVLGGKVTLTDRDTAMKALQDNVEHNMLSPNSDGAKLSGVVEVRELDWGNNLSDFPEPYDIILGADIIYIEETFPLLLKTLDHLSDCETRIYLSCKIRYDRDIHFLDMMRDLFQVTELSFDQERAIYVYTASKKCS